MTFVLLGSGCTVGPASPAGSATLGVEPRGQDGATGDDSADRETAAMDSTATQWSFQFAYQTMPNYKADTLANGQTRAEGPTDFAQLRIVAPLPFEEFTILPRLTLRHYENAQGESGLGNTELFGLVIPKSWDWGTGRGGIGPLVTFPGEESVSRDEWGYGVAAATVNASGPWFYGLLFTQSWRAVDPDQLPAGSGDTNPLGIAPFLNYRLGGGWYVGNGDMVAQYDWYSGRFYLPIAARIGKIFVQPKGSWNVYFEYQTSLIYDDWPGAAVEDSYRFNVSYTIPVGL